MTVISILYPILWVYPILRVFLLNTKYCPRTKYDCIVSAESFRSFTGHDFIHLYIQIRWGTLELVEEEAMWTEEAIPEQMIEEHIAKFPVYVIYRGGAFFFLFLFYKKKCQIYIQKCQICQ
eukprot:SAG11_NODE_159_length_14027_cov_6.893667_2_plen_121_part_00